MTRLRGYDWKGPDVRAGGRVFARGGFVVVTACAPGSELHRRCLESWARLMDPRIRLVLWANGRVPQGFVPERFSVRDMDELDGWREFLRLATREVGPEPPPGRPVDQRVDPRPGAARMFALAASIRHAESRVMRVIWLDTDVFVHRAVEVGFLMSITPTSSPVSFVWGKPICDPGFIAVDPASEPARAFVERVLEFYRSGAWVDADNRRVAEQMDRVRRSMETASLRFFDVSRGIGTRTRHPFVNGPLGSRMDHLRGTRKNAGATPTSDLIVARTEFYWRNREETPKSRHS